MNKFIQKLDEWLKSRYKITSIEHTYSHNDYECHKYIFDCRFVFIINKSFMFTIYDIYEKYGFEMIFKEISTIIESSYIEEKLSELIKGDEV